MVAPEPRHLLTAELLSIGTELTVGDTRDTNASELARSMTAMGVRVVRLSALPDDLQTVSGAFAAALERVDLVVSTGGLGPTPDDLTREAIAAVCGETPAVDPELEAWLRQLWARRGIAFPKLNVKQAWLIPSASSLPNPNGTAPGWFVTRPDGRVVVAMPGPPREMRPMWATAVAPRLAGIGIGGPIATQTYRLAGIGESQVAELLGEPMLRAANPAVATYARVEAVDVRISAMADGDRSADDLLEATAAKVLGQLGGYVWAIGDTSWSEAVGARLDELGWTLSIVEIGTGGTLGTLFGDLAALRFGESIALDAPAAHAHGSSSGAGSEEPDDDRDQPTDDLVRYAHRARELGGSEVGLAVRARTRTGDMAVSIAIATPSGDRQLRRAVFLTGQMGRLRAALSSASALLDVLREEAPAAVAPGRPGAGS
jgi:nicotinamide-nucleotide amidase